MVEPYSHSRLGQSQLELRINKLATGMEIQVFENKQQMVDAAVELLSTQVVATAEAASSQGIMLSGGSTPMAVYEAITASPLHAGPSQMLFLSDERMAPLDSEKNNFHNTQGMIDSLGASSLRVQTDLPTPEDAAQRYEADVQAYLDQGGSIPLGLLGMGADGHTASLFSTEDLARAEGHLAIAVDRPDGMQGISLTPTVFKAIDRIVFLIAGADKASMVENLIRKPDSVIAGRAVHDCNQVELWLDVEAHGQTA